MANSLIRNVTYVSDDSDGEDVFADYDPETVATQPLATLPHQTNGLHPKNSQQTHVTQPTQPLPNRPLNRTSPADATSTVQVNASSPLRPSLAAPSQSSPMHRGALNGGVLATSMAPPGTQFRSPVLLQQHQTQAYSQSADIDFSDDDRRAIDSSDDDEPVPAGIKQSVFVRGGKPINDSSDPNVIKDSPIKKPPDFAKYNYQPSSNIPQKRSADAMANAYSNPRSAKPPVQNGPSKALPVPLPEMDLNDVQDFAVRSHIMNMRNVFSNEFSIRECYEALRKKQFFYDDALDYLAQTQEKMAQRESIDLTNSDDIDELDAKTPNHHSSAPKLGAKRDVKNAKTINEKWSTQYPKPSASSRDSTERIIPRSKTPPPKKPKKRLVRPVQPPTPERSSPPVASGKKHDIKKPATANASKPVTTTAPRPAIESDVDEGIDLRRAVKDEDEDDDSESDNQSPSYSHHQVEFLEFLNQCSVDGLVELSNQSEEIARQIIDRRPYSSLGSVRDVTIESNSTTRSGKSRVVKKKIGERFVDSCLEMWDGYKAVDELVAECEQIGKPIQSEMKQLGFDTSSSEGELHLVDLETLDRDSGIGTPNPSSSVASGDEGTDDAKAASRPLRKSKLLAQPALMSPDCTLKDYQITGLNWLSILFAKNLSGILADDMGLGKTIQVIAFLSHLHEIKTKGAHLVVVPGSTLENWLREFKTFCPALRVEPYYGSQKDRVDIQYRIEGDLENINVIVTTYDMAVADTDSKFFRRIVKPTVCVFDEGHSLKNSRSRRYRQLMRIPARFRLLLTGTPLQNNLQELVSLLAFIMPDVFSSRDQELEAIFKHKGKAVDGSGHAAILSAQRISRARAMITPFILRRKKEQVLKHLPRKTCRIEHCDLTETQKALYNLQVAKVKAQWSEDGEASKSSKTKSNALMDLRKAAIHPLLFRYLYDDRKLDRMAKACLGEPQFAESNVDLVKEDMSVMTDYELVRFCRSYDKTMSKHLLPGTPWMDSGKVQKLLQVLQENMEAGHRTLVFSQFTMVMDILEEVLENADISFSRLDGATKMQERQDLIDQFTLDETISVFMLSTKAGGAGINLACANKVVIFDSSFNPQEDIQAENRAHRVGQTRPVEVVRLVTRGTIEEQIHALGKTKLALDDRVAGDGARDTKEEMAVEKEGMDMVEQMLKAEKQGQEERDGNEEDAEEEDDDDDDDDKKEEELVIQKKDDTDIPLEKTTSPFVKNKPRAATSDLRQEFIKGLRDAGLDVSDTNK